VRRPATSRHPEATDVCATEPERAARQRVAAGFAQNYDYALQVLTDLRYNAWRELDPEESLRFYARWLQEFGQLKSALNAVIAEGADWRFLNELKRELKAGKGPPGGSSLPGGFEISGEFRCRSFSRLGTSGPSPNLAYRSGP
jgi:hypothetical protein